MRDEYTDEIWASNVQGNFAVGSKPGVTFKHYGYDWQPMEHNRPVTPKELFNFGLRAYRGETMKREEMTEAACVFDEKAFRRRPRDFAWMDSFPAVSGKLAEILADVDFGEGGGLVPVPVYKADLKTLYELEFFMLNWGQHGVESLVTKESSVEVIGYEDRNPEGKVLLCRPRSFDDHTIAVNRAAFKAPDIWVEPRIKNLIFMKGWLAHALLDAMIKPDLDLHPCKIIDT